jgi:hypothetical protein
MKELLLLGEALIFALCVLAILGLLSLASLSSIP